VKPHSDKGLPKFHSEVKGFVLKVHPETGAARISLRQGVPKVPLRGQGVREVSLRDKGLPKGFVKPHSDKGFPKFYSEVKGFVKFHSETRGSQRGS
jgi:hypothetical protein